MPDHFELHGYNIQLLRCLLVDADKRCSTRAALFLLGDVVHHLFSREICGKRPSSGFGPGVSGHFHGNMRHFRCLLFFALVDLVKEALLLQLVRGEAFASTAKYLMPQKRQLIMENIQLLLEIDYQPLKFFNVSRQCCRFPSHDAQHCSRAQ
ncbi:MAG TPA: hypothetical protein VL354_08045 [Spirochaetia bacterium]|nr:hypothetical protein [Spirochaetia bacterium]